MNLAVAKVAFWISAIYDVVLGVIFLLVPYWLFNVFDTPLPGHPAYVQFPAILLIAFGLMFRQIAGDPVKFVYMIPYGAALKIAYSGVVLGYWLTTGISFMWKPFAIVDIVLLVIFAQTWLAIRKQKG